VGTLALVASITAVSGSALAQGQRITRQTQAGPYRLVLQIGKAEAMQMRGASGTGERMVRGRPAACRMGSMAGMSMGHTTCNHHLELHVYARAGGKVVDHARVLIRLVNTATHRITVVPIMTMMGREGMSDLHYGNNIAIASGSYRVVVHVHGISAAFAVRLT